VFLHLVKTKCLFFHWVVCLCSTCSLCELHVMIEKLFIVLRSLVCNYHVIRSRIINIRANCLLGGLLQQFGMMVHIRVTGVKRKKHIEQASQFCCSDLGWNCFSGYQFGEG